jgi:integrase
MSVRKREWKTPNGEQREAWVVNYTDQNGKRRLKTFDRKKEADAYAAKTAVEVRAGIHTADSASVTVAEAGVLWVKSADSNGLERSTIEMYRQHVEFHIKPYLGRRKLSELSVPVIRDFEDRLLSGFGDLAPRSPALVRKIIISLNSLVADAQERGLVSRNVVRDLRAGRKRGKEERAERRQRGKLKVGVDIPTPQEIRAIVGALQGRWRPLLLTAIFTGLRVSELRGLTWANVNLDKRELYVRQRADKYNVIGRPKSEAGERTVPLPPIVVNTLREWKIACPKDELNLVFPTGSGKVQALQNIVVRGLHPAQISAGVKTADGKAKYTGMHALRHFYASWCINRRADGGLELPAKVVQGRLGHSSIVMTMDRYGHLFPSDDHASELAAAEQALLA